MVLLEVHGFKLYFDADTDTPLRSLVAVGTYEAFESKIFQSLLRPGMVVVDIGANVGYYTMLAATGVGETGLVLACEPDSRHFNLLTRSIDANGYTNIIARQLALSNQAGSAFLYMDSVNSGNSSLALGNVAQELGRITVGTLTLDAFVEREACGRKIDLLKIDVQGAEGLILDGGQQVFASRPLTVMMEFEPEKLRQMHTDPAVLLGRLARLGFRIRVLNAARARVDEFPQPRILAEALRLGYVNLLLEKAA